MPLPFPKKQQPSGPPPVCLCSKPLICRETITNAKGNQGRWFYKCTDGDACAARANRFQWADEPWSSRDLAAKNAEWQRGGGGAQQHPSQGVTPTQPRTQPSSQHWTNTQTHPSQPLQATWQHHQPHQQPPLQPLQQPQPHYPSQQAPAYSQQASQQPWQNVVVPPTMQSPPWQELYASSSQPSQQQQSQEPWQSTMPQTQLAWQPTQLQPQQQQPQQQQGSASQVHRQQPSSLQHFEQGPSQTLSQGNPTQFATQALHCGDGRSSSPLDLTCDDGDDNAAWPAAADVSPAALDSCRPFRFAGHGPAVHEAGSLPSESPYSQQSQLADPFAFSTPPAKAECPDALGAPLAPSPRFGGTSSSQAPPTQLQPHALLPASSFGAAPLLGVSVRVVVLSRHQVGFAVAPFNLAFANVMKGLQSVDPTIACAADQNMWLVPAQWRKTAASRLATHGFTVQKLPPGLEALMDDSAEFVRSTPEVDAAKVVRSSIPSHIYDKLFPFQQSGVQQGVQLGGRVMLADEMGLGKTVQSLCIAACYPDAWPLLIVCPSSLRYVWKQALHRWLPQHLLPPEDDLWVISEGKQLASLTPPPGQRHVCIVSYDLVKKMDVELLKRYQVVICDESHKLKEPSTQRTTFVSKLVKCAKRAILVTGTPMMSRPIEVWTQVDMLRPNMLGSYHDYGNRYCDPQPTGAVSNRGPFMSYRGHSNLEELHLLLTHTVMIRRTKDQVLTQLPPKIRQVVPLKLEPAAQRDVNELRRQLDAARRPADAAGAQPDSSNNAHAADTALQAYCQATGVAKVAQVFEFVQTLLEKDVKLLLFAHHHKVLDALEAKLKANTTGKTGYIRIDGTTSMARREAAVQEFQDDEHVGVALLSIQAAGVGLTLCAAQAVVFAELDWTPANLHQAEDRIHRIGAVSPCNIYYLLAQSSGDDIMWRAILNKDEAIASAINGGSDDAGSSPDAAGWGAAVDRLAERQRSAAEAGADDTQPGATGAAGGWPSGNGFLPEDADPSPPSAAATTFAASQADDDLEDVMQEAHLQFEVDMRELDLQASAVQSERVAATTKYEVVLQQLNERDRAISDERSQLGRRYSDALLRARTASLCDAAAVQRKRPRDGRTSDSPL